MGVVHASHHLLNLPVEDHLGSDGSWVPDSLGHGCVAGGLSVLHQVDALQHTHHFIYVYPESPLLGLRLLKKALNPVQCILLFYLQFPPAIRPPNGHLMSHQDHVSLTF